MNAKERLAEKAYPLSLPPTLTETTNLTSTLTPSRLGIHGPVTELVLGLGLGLMPGLGKSSS